MPRTAYLAITLLTLTTLTSSLHAETPANTTGITWKKSVLDKKFRGEGVAVADVNKDGKIDVINRMGWYEAPDWKFHAIIEPKDYGDGSNGYSNCFACWTDDINKDGWADLIVIDFPGDPCYWLENPKGKEGLWKKHIIWHSACNETPIYVDLFGNGQKALVMGFQPKGKDNEGQMAYFTPSSDPYAIWDMHPISEPAIPATFKVTADSLEALKKEGVPESFLTSLSAIKDKSFPNVGELVKAASKGENAKEWQAQQGKIDQKTRINGRDIPGTFRFAHGLGAGDVNGDGRLDVLTTGGWWEQPAGKTDKAWTFHPANLGNANADMYCLDVDGDGVTDVIGSSAHNFGIWWFQGKKDSNGNYSFQQRDLFPKLVSQTHALHFVDINGDGLKDLVTGKRWWAHGPRGDAEPNAPATIFWIEARKGKDGATTFIPHQVDNDSGIGTQFAVADINGDGLPDIITSNKKGVYVFEQVRAKK